MLEPQTYILVATPCFDGHISGIYSTSLLKLHQACFLRHIPLGVKNILGDALITRARQNLLTHFMEDKHATHLLFVDSDIGFEPDQVFRLLDFDADFTTAAYPTKRINWTKAAALIQAGKPLKNSAVLDYVMEVENPGKITTRKGFARVKSAGTGFMMIRRGAVQRMMEHYADLSYKRDLVRDDELKDSKWRRALFNCVIDQKTGTYLSEDYSFCRRWTDMGGEIWMDLRSQLIHAGTAYFEGDVSGEFAKLD